MKRGTLLRKLVMPLPPFLGPRLVGDLPTSLPLEVGMVTLGYGGYNVLTGLAKNPTKGGGLGEASPTSMTTSE